MAKSSYRGRSRGVNTRRIQGAGLKRGMGGGCGPKPPPGPNGGCHAGHPHGHPHGGHTHEHIVHHCPCPEDHMPNGNGRRPGGGFEDPTGGWITDRPNGNGGVPPMDPWRSMPNGDPQGMGYHQGVAHGPNAVTGNGYYAFPKAGSLTFKQRRLAKLQGKRPLTLSAKQAYRRGQGWFY